ncbi:MAG: 6-phosphofructokinase [Fastidiosipilaceae bacterium]
MEKLIGNAIFGQSGGPTAVINSSAAGVIMEGLKHSDVIPKVYGAAHGIVGMLNEDFYDMAQEDPHELELLKTTPSSSLGSVRYKLADPDVDDTDYKRLLEVFKKYDIRYFFYNGGNDSMDTCNKVSKYMQKVGYDCRVMGVPKTIDNDLYGTDHCPGFSSAAKFIATSCMEVYQDARVYNTGLVIIVEIMGRNAGWLTAAAALASHKGSGPDLVYLPEVVFDVDQMIEDIKKVYAEKGNVMVAVSEGVHDKDGKFIPELIGEVKVDAFGHKQMGGTAAILADKVADAMDVKIRHIELSLLQRAAAHIASKSDVDEAYEAGATAVREAIKGASDYMVGFERTSNDPYVCEMKLIPLSKVANTEKTVPLEWINEEGNGILQGFIDYALPLIKEDSVTPKEDGLPRYARLKKVPAKK